MAPVVMWRMCTLLLCKCHYCLRSWGVWLRGWGVHSCQSGLSKGMLLKPGAHQPRPSARRDGLTCAQQTCQCTRTAWATNDRTLLMAAGSGYLEWVTLIHSCEQDRSRGYGGQERLMEEGKRRRGSPGWCYLWSSGGVVSPFVNQTEIWEKPFFLRVTY